MTQAPDSLAAAQIAIADRLARFPDSPFFLFARRDVDRVAERLSAGPPVDWAFYRSLKVGLMCARELETVDMPFCDAIYTLLTDIRPTS